MEEENQYPREEMILISQLLLDTQNPRLPEVQTSQREAVRAMAKTQGEKIIALAQHIRDNGTNPTSLLGVMPAEDDDGKYVVLDGNRRLTALKVLETPSLVEGVLDGKALQRLRRMSAVYLKKPVSRMRCIVFANREEADIWIQLIHRGYQSGAGLVEWDGQVAARYDARKGNKSAALQVLDFVKENADLSLQTRQKIEAGKFPITNLARLVNTPYVRKKLGIDILDNTVVKGFPNDEVLKGLTRVVEDLGSGRVTVSSIKSQEQRIDYVNLLNETDLPQQDRELPAVQPLESPEERDEYSVSPSPPISVSRKTPSIKRSTLIPREARLGVTHHRIKKIYSELKNLELDKFPNAGAVMFRVFIELSVDHYLDVQLGWPEKQIDNSYLAQKLTAVMNHFEQGNIMTPLQLSPVKKATGGQTLLAASVKTFHSYVHNRYFSPIASELKTAWDDLQPFMGKIWPI